MRLATFLPPDPDNASPAPRAGTVAEGHATAFADEGVTVLDILSAASPADAAAAQPQGPSWPLEEVALLAPVPAPRAIFGIGLNYADHIAETGGERPERPIVFMKLPSSATAPGAAVRCPEVVRRLDYEGELAVVIGADGTVAGYAVADDVSARDLQGREPQWTRAKGADDFCPYGPWITTADEVPDPHALSLRTWVNGELRQDSNTSNLIFTVPELVAFLAETCTLAPGDLILTGTPSGVGLGLDPQRFLASGDVVRIEIERLGAIEHSIA
jgi:2-keto-4-pentenoate hydratase/2-oxohepta-3-ene-1,7-dioic acid hydratase in catechol pathway